MRREKIEKEKLDEENKKQSAHYNAIRVCPKENLSKRDLTEKSLRSPHEEDQILHYIWWGLEWKWSLEICLWSYIGKNLVRAGSLFFFYFGIYSYPLTNYTDASKTTEFERIKD